MLDDDLSDFDLTEVVEAIESTGAQPSITPIEELQRIDVFSCFRDQHDQTIGAAGLPWSAPSANVIDYYRGPAGWMLFLERSSDTVSVRLRHEFASIDLSKAGVVLAWNRDHSDFPRIQQIVHAAIAEGRSPLYDLLLSNELPEFIALPLRDQLPSPLNTSITVTGDLLFSARRELIRHLVQATIYTRRPA